ncbi:hypothetical protein [Alteromonas ponticola]|uniref:STAS/SEC14 domain-containing protein n=1 Tax=Alteromonas ponticola TaxID=2720613 RepID=A0ABX1R3G5_9ALTE|nr:hypothetical protein [Alteromonas ponticola]NMH60980.1 hypothetical protein [Alteromonas ponticola]
MKIFTNPQAKLKSKYGQYQIAVLGNVVAVSAEGIADTDAIARYGSDMMEVVSQFNGHRWAFLGFLHGSALLTKGGEIELQKSIEWRVSKGMVLGAIVTGETTIAAMVNAQFSRIYERAGVELGVFSNEDAAMAWLAEKGFRAS